LIELFLHRFYPSILSQSILIRLGVPLKSGKRHSSKRELAHEVATIWKLILRVDRECCPVGDPLSICYCFVKFGDRTAQLYKEIPLMKIEQK
nr:hypothetical protein [Tanacetum cinerariifolium]